MKNIKEAIGKGEILWGTLVMSSSPVSVEISGYAGFDFTWIDTEHGSACPYGGDVENLIRGAYAADIFPICRVVKNDPAQIKKLLDFGAKGIIAPFISTKGEAEKLAEACLFPPKGKRGGCPEVRAVKYGAMEWDEFVEKSNREIVIMPLIEQMEAIENLEDILAVEGINAVLFGGFDLAMDLRSYQKDMGKGTGIAPVHEHMDYVVRTCKKRNIPVMGVAWDLESALEMVHKGFRLITYAACNNLFYRILKEFLDKARREMKLNL